MPDWESILEVARFAPSPHNTQPWRVRVVDAHRAVLLMERTRMLPDEDVTGHFLIHAMGMFLEAMRIVAANAGMTFRHTVIGCRSDAPLIAFAEMELSADGAPEAGFENELLTKRMTSRRPSNGRRIAPELAASLKAFEPAWGQRFSIIDERATMDAIVERNIAAVFGDLNDPKYHDEIARWFRYSDRQSTATRDGLDHQCMIVPAAELRLMRTFPQVMKWPLLRGLTRNMYRRQLGLVSQIGLIDGPFFEDSAALAAGHFLLRFWLELARHDLMIHPFGNLVTNPAAHEWIRQRTGLQQVWLVFRIGYTDAPPRSRRRSVAEILIHD